ncbi:hypothetical protein [Paraglaciecola sp.]|uniref:hypothetical protein n=1 Tax=Paraglaciecola sp. TaxID=1920173 RepID=UPI003EF45DB6
MTHNLANKPPEENRIESLKRRATFLVHQARIHRITPPKRLKDKITRVTIEKEISELPEHEQSIFREILNKCMGVNK